MRVVRSSLMIVMAFVAACGGEEPSSPDGAAGGSDAGGSAPTGCELGSVEQPDGTCQLPGLPADLVCAPGETQLASGDCAPAGVPPEACAEGFTHDGEAVCVPVLPASPCTGPMMAIPGDAECRAIASCGDATWGAIDTTDTTTQFVDPSYTGGNSDGTTASPWTTLGAALSAAQDGAIVALAAGRYEEAHNVTGKAVRVVGRCPELVELVATVPGTYAILHFGEGTAGSEVRNLAVTGAAYGLAFTGPSGVLIDRVWAHDNAHDGVWLNTDGTLGDATITNSAIVANGGGGVVAVGVDLLVDSTVISDSKLTADHPSRARGIAFEDDLDLALAGALTVRRSVVDRNADIGIFVAGSEALIEGSVVRDTQFNDIGIFGFGIGTISGPDAITDITVRSSYLEGNRSISLFVENSVALVESTVIRDSLPNEGGAYGRALQAQPDPVTAVHAPVVVRNTAMEGFPDVGAFVIGSQGTFEGVRVVGGAASSPRYGLAAIVDLKSSDGAQLSVSASSIEQVANSGIFSEGASVDIETTWIRHSGRGVALQLHPMFDAPAPANLHAVLIEDSAAGSVVSIGAEVSISDSVFRRSIADESGAFGDGVISILSAGRGAVTLARSHVDTVDRAAVSNFGTVVTLSDSRFTCQAFDFNGETFNDTPATWQDGGNNGCGCDGAIDQCKAVSSSLAAPDPLPAPEQ